MKVLKPSDENIQLAASLLRQGEIVAIPTETVYGLAGNAFDEKALTKIFAAKERPTFDPLIIHVAPAVGLGHMLDRLGALRLVDRSHFSQQTERLIEHLLESFWPGPLTLVLPKHRDVPDLATSGLATVAVRMPRHPIAQKLITAAGIPLAAPSANRFGRISPTRPAHVVAELGDRVDFVLDGGPCEVGLESTVLELTADGDVSLLRPGGISVAELEKTAGVRIQIEVPRRSKGTLSPQYAAPGMLESHYAPRKPLKRIAKPALELSDEEWRTLLENTPADKTIGILLFQGDEQALTRALTSKAGRSVVACVLSPSGDLTEAARGLFEQLRALDASCATVLFCEPCPNESGLGYAIADRLRRASS